MGKRNPYRFSIGLDENDTEHRLVGDYLNTLGRRKAKIIVKAVLAYLEEEKNHQDVIGQKAVKDRSGEADKEKEPRENTGRLLRIDMDYYSMDEAEIALMRRNYDKMGKEG